MPSKLARVRTLVLEVPRGAKLAYCLLRDSRVPRAPKVVLISTLGLIVSPLDLPAWIPVVGELDVLALGVLSVKVFIEACPEEIVREHRAALKRRDSVFDRDLRRLLAAARQEARVALGRVLTGRGRGRHVEPRILEDESA